MKRSIKPTFRMISKDLLRTCAGFFAVIVVLLAVICSLVLLRGRGSGEISGFGMIAAVFLFVIGIVAPRSYVRQGLQLGVSRGTVFISQLLAVLAASAAMSVAGELIFGLAQLAADNTQGLRFMDLYQMLYRLNLQMSLADHLISIVFNVCLALCAYYSGMFFTNLFWRLNKLWTVAAVILMVIGLNLLINLAPVGIEFSPLLHDLAVWFVNAVTSGPWALMGFFLLWAVIAGVIDWLLLRRAPIKTAK